MPQIELPLGTPWWAVWILVLLMVVSTCLVRLAKVLLPPPEQRGQWWRDLLAFLQKRREPDELPPSRDRE